VIRLYPQGLLLATVLASAVLASGDAGALDGRLTGGYAEWGPTSVHALSSRDFAVPPLAEGIVAADGSFSLDLPPETTSVYLALWPEHGGAYPLLLKELPYALPPAEPIVIPLPPPPKHRDARQALVGPSIWLVSGILLAILALVVFGGRGLLLGRENGGTALRERWIPPNRPPKPGGKLLIGIVGLVVGLLVYGVVALNEAMDLLEYTYFQEAFSGSNPISVAFSPVVAERAHAPGYAMFLWFMVQVSSSEIWLRMPSLLSAAAGAWFMFRLTADGTGSRTAGWLAAVFGAMAPLAMRYGRDVTPYSTVGLLAVASTWLLYRSLVTGERKMWIGFATVGAAGFFLHYFTAFLVIGQAGAVLWLWIRGGRGTFWSTRARQALLWFGALGVLPLLWASQVIRAFIISAQDNLVTHAVYPIAPGFFTYTVEHFRVLLGLPAEIAFMVWPMFVLLVVSYVVLLKDHPTFGRVLLIPFVMMLGLLATTYALHSYAYGGRVYYGWRWLRPYTAAIAAPIAWLMVRSLPKPGRIMAVGLGGILLAATVFSGTRSALTRERPAQIAAANYLLERAVDRDAIAVLPAAFYTVGWSYYLHERTPKYIHPGPSIWQYFPRGEETVRVFGPIRSFGIPLESYVGHIDIARMWVTVFDEQLFGQPEFDPELPGHVLDHLQISAAKQLKASFPFMQLWLFETPATDPWKNGTISVDTQHLYRSLRWLPGALDPDHLFQLVQGKTQILLKFPTQREGQLIAISVAGVPGDATPGDLKFTVAERTEHPGEARLQPPAPILSDTHFDGTYQATLTPTRSDAFELVIVRSERARDWPLIVTLTAQ
jgi:hypothetical protein